MTRARLFVVPFAGAAGETLPLVGGSSCIPPIGYMGGKRKLASAILGALGLHVGQGAEHVVLVDAGPWGEAWGAIFDAQQRAAVVGRLRSWRGEDPSALWERLRDAGRPEDLAERVASWLWLQGRSVNSTPVWWEQGQLVNPGNGSKGPGLTPAFQNTCWRLTMPEKANRGEPLKNALERSTRKKSDSRHASSGVTRPDTVADRIERIAAAPWRQVTILRAHAELLALDLAGAVVYMDPPYQGCTRYAALCSRAEVLDLATTLRDRADRVAVSEACPLPLEGWHTLRLPTRRPEWLTCSKPPAAVPAVQLTLWAA